MIRKEATVSRAVLREVRRIIEDSGVLHEDDANWPSPDRGGRQELEIVLGNEHISFTTAAIGTLTARPAARQGRVGLRAPLMYRATSCGAGSVQDVNSSNDPEGLRVFYYLVQDLRCLVISLISLHFKIKPL